MGRKAIQYLLPLLLVAALLSACGTRRKGGENHHTGKPPLHTNAP